MFFDIGYNKVEKKNYFQILIFNILLFFLFSGYIQLLRNQEEKCDREVYIRMFFLDYVLEFLLS